MKKRMENHVVTPPGNEDSRGKKKDANSLTNYMCQFDSSPLPNSKKKKKMSPPFFSHSLDPCTDARTHTHNPREADRIFPNRAMLKRVFIKVEDG